MTFDFCSDNIFECVKNPCTLEDVRMSYEKVTQAKHLSIGLKQTLKSLERDMAIEIIIAKDAERRVTQKLIRLADEKRCPLLMWIR